MAQAEKRLSSKTMAILNQNANTNSMGSFK